MTEISDSTVFCLAPNASFQSLGEGAVILMIDSGQLYTCNETTEAFLDMIDGERNFGTILDLMVAEFAVDRDTLAQDLLPIADKLRSGGIIDIRSGPQ